jgi:hypothetical protein
MERRHVADTGNGFQMYILAASTLNKTGIVRINVTWRRVLATTVVVEIQ